MLKELLDVAGHADARRNLDASVQHAENLSELGVLNDTERAVATRTPDHDQVAELGFGIGRPSREGRERLSLGGLGWLASANVPQQIAGRILVCDPVEVHARMTAKRRGSDQKIRGALRGRGLTRYR